MKVLGHNVTRQWIAAVVTFLFGVCSALMMIRDVSSTRDYVMFAATIVIAFVGAFALFANFGPQTSAAVLSFGVSFSMIFQHIFNVVSEDPLMFIISTSASVLLGVAMLCSVSLYSGYRYNAVRLKLFFLIMTGIYFIPLLFAVQAAQSLRPIYTSYLYDTMAIIQLLVIVYDLMDPTLTFVSIRKRTDRNILALGNSLCNDSSVYIWRDDLRKMMTFEHWDITGEGPVTAESNYPLTALSGTIYLTVQKWADGRCVFRVRPTDKANEVKDVAFVYRDADYYTGIDDTIQVTFYGDKGFFMTLMVADKPKKEEKKWKKFVNILFGLEPRRVKKLRKAGEELLKKL